MKNFDLSIYKGTKVYIKYFDIYMKINDLKKEEVLSKLIISNSSFRRSRESEQKIGRSIISDLANYFKLNIPNNELIDQLQININKIYHNMYYKIYKEYEEEQQYIDDLLSQNLIIEPILNLIKLFLKVNNNDSVARTKQDNLNMYKYLKLYSEMFTEELKEILEILSIFFDDEIHLDQEWNQEYKNAMSYQIASARYLIENKYIEAIYFSELANKMLIDDMNFKRVIVVNRTIMGAYLFLGKYKECLNMAEKQYLYVQSIDFSQFEIDTVFKFKIVSLLGLERYEDIISLLNDYTKMNYTLFTCYAISLFYVNKKEYIELYNDNIDDYDDMTKSYFILLDQYLKTNDKSLINEFLKYNVIDSITIILRNLKMNKNKQKID